MRTSRPAIILVGLILSCSIKARAAIGGGDDTCATATLVSAGTYAGLSTFGSWSFPTNITWDDDWVRFSALPGQRIDVTAQITSTSGSTSFGYTFMSLFAYDFSTCNGAQLSTSFANHVSVLNTTTAAKEYVVRYYAGVNASGHSFTVNYDLVVQATSVFTGIDYCPGLPNSLGLAGVLALQGTNSVAANNLVFSGFDMLPNSFALLASGTARTSVPFGDGNLCIGGALRRLFVLPLSATGTMSVALDIPNLPPASAITAGDVRYFQLYYRDSFGPLGTGFNLTNAQCVGFTP